MERIILPYEAPGQFARPTFAHASTAPSQVIHPTKAASDFIRAIKRRSPLIVMVTVLVGTLGAAYVVKMPAVYRAVGQIQIEPPQFDTHISIILANGSIPNLGKESIERYVPNRLARLQGRGIAEAVIQFGDLGAGKGYEGDPPAELMGNLSNRRLVPGTNIFEIALEGKDPERVTKLLRDLLYKFEDSIRTESRSGLEKAEVEAQKNLNELMLSLKTLDNEIETHTRAAPIFAPGNKYLPLEEYTIMKNDLTTKRFRYDTMKHEERIASMYPGLKEASAPPSKYKAKIDYLLERKEYYTEQLEAAARLTRNVNTDPASKRLAELLDKVMDDLEEMSALDTPQGFPDQSGIVMAHTAEEIRKLEREVNAKMNQVQQTMPAYQQYVTMQSKRELLERQIASTQERLTQFKWVNKTISSPIEILQKPTEPGGPIKPNRPMLIGLFCLLGFVMGSGVVCAFEFLDHSVKVPEHLSAGLTLPILTVIPRMRRLARLHRGGHLWTDNDPLSTEADAYRNLRASLIGVNGPKGPIVTLLVTSAKTGEGKSTTALNLALTCARAGERTLLMDVDLRRPSLAEVFGVEKHEVGLVDVLRGDMPWQQAIVRTDIPNLNFLPTGDPTNVPIEVLGTLELRQLIAAVSKGYQRVILDAPAVLGLADCRMLGRTVDAAILVVRSGAHELRPLRRAKDMLEQSRVPLAGVVFNGLTDDLDNWASYGPNILHGRANLASRQGLNSPSDEVAFAAANQD